MHLDTARQITAEQFDAWADAMKDKEATPACAVWIIATPGGADFALTTDERIEDFDLADMLESLARLIRFQARNAARRRRV